MPKVPQERFDALIAPQLPNLFRVAYRLMRNTADARDLVQDTCVIACENPADLVGADHPSRWLVRVLYNRFLNGARRLKRSPFVTLVDAAESVSAADEVPGPEDLLQQAHGEQALDRAWLQLEDAQRAVLSLRAEGYDLEEIERITGIGKDVLRARLHRARRSFARHLDNERRASDTKSRVGSKP